MFYGILAGITWAIETVVLGIALNKYTFCSTEQAIALAPFVSTFLHDLFSALYSTIYNAFHHNLHNVWNAFKTNDGKWVVFAAIIGGPIGMTGYVMSVNYMGASIGAVASAIFPAVGSILAYIFLKEKMKWYQWIFLIITLLGVYGLSYSPDLNIKNFWLGFFGAAMCSFGWGIEAVILAKSLHNPDLKDEFALQIRQTTSAIVYGIVIIPVLSGWGFVSNIVLNPIDNSLLIISIAGLFATISYLFYYKAIASIGASKAMALNVTYTAWAIFFTVLFLKDTSVLNFTTILCSLIVLVFGIFAATDFKNIISKE